MTKRDGVYSGGAKHVSVVLKDYSNTDTTDDQADLHLHSPIDFKGTCTIYESFALTNWSDEFIRMPDPPFLEIPPELATCSVEGGRGLVTWKTLENIEFNIVLTGKQRIH